MKRYALLGRELTAAERRADRRIFAALVIGMAVFLALLLCFGSDGATLRVRDLPSCSALAAGDWLPVDLLTPPTTCKATTAQLGSFLSVGAFSGVGACTNQVVTGLNGGAAPTCANVSSAMIANGAIVDADVNASAAIAESKLALNFATHSSANDPTAGQKAALAGTNGTPGSGVKYVTETDPKVVADQAAGTASIRTLGPGATQAAAGNHAHVAGDITSGVFPIARLATGTPDGTKFVRDDGTLAVPSGGGGSGNVAAHRTSDQSYITTLMTDDSQLSVTLASSSVYLCSITAYTTSDAGGGIQTALGGTATMTNIIGRFELEDSTGSPADYLRVLALNTATTAVTGDGGYTARYSSVLVEVNAGGTFLFRAAKASASAVATKVLRGSSITCDKH